MCGRTCQIVKGIALLSSFCSVFLSFAWLNVAGADVVLDDFESYTAGQAVADAAAWSSTGSGQTVVIEDPNDPGNQVLSCTGNNLNVYYQLGLLALDDTQQMRLAFDVRLAGTNAEGFNVSLGSSASSGPGAFTDYQAQCRVLTEFLQITIDHLDVRDGGVFVTVADTDRDNWYHVTMDLDNPANLFDFQVDEGNYVSYGDAGYRNTAAGTNSFFIKSSSSGTTGTIYLDNLTLSDPPAACVPVPADGNINGDHRVDLFDVAGIFAFWLVENCYGLDDLKVIAEHWLELIHDAPAVFAGADKLIVLPNGITSVNQAVLLNDAQVSDDGFPEPPSLAVQWSYESGPGSVTFAPNDQVLDPNVTVSGPLGDYVLRLTADDGDKSAYDEVIVRAFNTYAPPASHRVTYNFNPDWRFIKQDVPGAENPAFDDSGWSVVSAPHTYNDVDTFDNFMEAGQNGERSMFTGKTWYRKHFKMPAEYAGRKVFIEFEGVRQTSDVYLNGTLLGTSENGFVPFGYDLTDYLNFGDTENVLAVMVDNTFPMPTRADAAELIPWHDSHWHPTHGGIYRNVVLHVTDLLHVTLPLYSHLQTTGTYVYAENISSSSADVTVEAEVANEYAASQLTTFEAMIVDEAGNPAGSVGPQDATINAGQTHVFSGGVTLSNPALWSPDSPSLYTVYVIVRTGSTVLDVAQTTMGIRDGQFTANAGFFLNGEHLKLHGWGHKPTTEWAGLGAALPRWLHGFDSSLMKEAGGNFIRWGHCSGPADGIQFADQNGIIVLQPGVDGEADTSGDRWDIRAAAFRDTIIYFRNHPSVLIWEGGNQNVSDAHAQQLAGYIATYDPHGGRVYAHRRPSSVCSYIDVTVGTEGGHECSALPVVEGEYDREESPRRVWDDFSPPDYDYYIPPEKLTYADYDLTSEQYAVNQVSQWWNKVGSKADHCGGANWIFSDSTSHGRMEYIECTRTSGEVDAVRLPKEGYYVCRAMWRNEPTVHVIGHWSYPAMQPDNSPTVKNIYAASNCEQVELFVNDVSKGYGARTNQYLFTWNNIAYEAGTIRVVGYNGGSEAASQEKQTAGPPHHIQLTPIMAAGGLKADGSDIVLIDVEVVDDQGNRCPTDQDRVDFTISGPGIWRGGYNSGIEGSTNNLYLNTECGINRVAVRSTLTAGPITVTASRTGLPPGVLNIDSQPISIIDGLSTDMPSSN